MVSPHEFMLELWIEYTLGSVIVLIRLLTQLRVAGIRGFRPDDWLVILAWAIYTVETPMAHVIGVTVLGTNAGWTDEQRRTMSGEKLEGVVLASKCFLIGWLCYAGTVWILKLCMAFFFKRITEGLAQQKYIKPAMGYVLATWLAISLLLLLNCRPIFHYWQVYPDPGPKCTWGDSTPFVVGLALNVSSDMLLMAIPTPIILKAKISRVRKALLVVLFCGGFFIMIAATLRVVYFFSLDPTLPAAWSCRETFVAFCVTNAPMLSPLFRRSFWNLPPRSASASKGPSSRSKGYERSSSMELSHRLSHRSPYPTEDLKVTTSDSTERMVDPDEESGKASLVIQTNRTVDVTSSDIEGGAARWEGSTQEAQKRSGRLGYGHYSVAVGR